MSSTRVSKQDARYMAGGHLMLAQMATTIEEEESNAD